MRWDSKWCTNWTFNLHVLSEFDYWTGLRNTKTTPRLKRSIVLLGNKTRVIKPKTTAVTSFEDNSGGNHLGNVLFHRITKKKLKKRKKGGKIIVCVDAAAVCESAGCIQWHTEMRSFLVTAANPSASHIHKHDFFFFSSQSQVERRSDLSRGSSQQPHSVDC